jgi:hypothetical protein
MMTDPEIPITPEIVQANRHCGLFIHDEYGPIPDVNDSLITLQRFQHATIYCETRYPAYMCSCHLYRLYWV